MKLKTCFIFFALSTTIFTGCNSPCSNPNQIARDILLNDRAVEAEPMQYLLQIHSKYHEEYPGSNDIFHFITYFRNGLTDIAQQDFFTAFFIYKLAENADMWNTPFFIDRNILRNIENKYFKRPIDDVFKLLFFTAGAYYFQNVHHDLSFTHFNFVTPELDSISTTEFKNKVLVIDFGASWCKPCKEQVPYLKKIISKFKNTSNVQFLSISIDTDSAKWLEQVSKTSYMGRHLHGKISGKDLPVYKSRYGLMSIPRYYVVDATGIIATYDGPRPNSGIYEELIRQVARKRSSYFN